MSEKFRNKYRIPSARLVNWDYRWNAAYFITICTQHREHFFGHIVDGIMKLSSIGIIADVLWHEITNHARNVELDAFVVMPNHIHGILIINDDLIKSWDDNGTNSNSERNYRFETDPVETLHATSLPTQPPTQPPTPPPTQPPTQPPTPQQTSPPSPSPQNPKNDFMATISPKSDSVSTIIRSYKSAVSKHAHRLGFDFAWQTRFHDHIIRDDESFLRIQSYIRENPMKWEEDDFFT